MGKTYFLSALVKMLRESGMNPLALKPVCSGLSEMPHSESDPAHLLRAQGLSVDLENIQAICPWQYQAPLTPSMAAALENKEVDLNAIVAFCERAVQEHTLTFVEGVGGIMAPMTPTQTVLDWVVQLQWPCILVVGSYLGSISHTLTALKTLESAGVEAPIVVVNETKDSSVSFEGTLQALTPFVGGRDLIPLRHQQGLASEALARIILKSVPETV